MKKLSIDHLLDDDDANELEERLGSDAPGSIDTSLIDTTKGICEQVMQTLGTFAYGDADMAFVAEEIALKRARERLVALSAAPYREGRTAAVRQLLELLQNPSDPGFARAVDAWLRDPRVDVGGG